MPKVVDGVERKTSEEIDILAKDAQKEFKIEGKIKKNALKTEGAQPLESNVSPIKSVGSFKTEPAKQDSAMQKVFKKIEAPRSGWIKMNEDEVIEYQSQGILIGHDPEQGIGLLRKE